MARLLTGGCPSNHGGCGERSGGCERGARSSLLRRAFRHASSVVAALPALAPRLVRLARHGYPDRLLQVGEQALDRLLVRLVDQRGLAEPALLLAGLVGQDVAEVAAPPLHLALGGQLEALGRAPARLDLRHRGPFLLAD